MVEWILRGGCMSVCVHVGVYEEEWVYLGQSQEGGYMNLMWSVLCREQCSNFVVM